MSSPPAGNDLPQASTSASTSASAIVGSGATAALANEDQAQQQAMMANSHPDMHLDTRTGKWVYEDAKTGQEYEWNTTANAWVPVVDDDLMEAQQKAYSVAGVDESTPANVTLARDRRKKRKAGDGDEDESRKKAAKPAKGPRNTAVFIQHLPLDATIEEVSSVFSKAGMILLDADDNPKIKLYTDKATGLRNGDGLVIYYKEESVELALSLLDESPLRLGDKENMKVVKAEWSHKQGENSKGNSNGDDEKSRKAKSSAQAQKMQRRAEKLQREAADYDPSYDERAAPILSTTATKPSGRVVVLAHVFTLEELAEDASLLLDLKEDVREECESLGKVTNVVLYDKEPDGIVTIKFSDPVAAQACVIKNNGRFFGGRQLKAWIYDGKTRYQKSGSTDFAVHEGEGEAAAEKRRLEEFGKWLEEDGA